MGAGQRMAQKTLGGVCCIRVARIEALDHCMAAVRSIPPMRGARQPRALPEPWAGSEAVPNSRRPCDWYRMSRPKWLIAWRTPCRTYPDGWMTQFPI